MKKLSLLVIGIALSMSVMAQNTPITKSNYELPARFSTANMRRMVQQTFVSPTFLKNGKEFWYSFKTSAGTSWYIVDGVKGTKTELFDPAEMAAKITEVTLDPCDAQHLPLKNIRFAEDGKTFTFEVTSSQNMSKEEREAYEEYRQKSESEKKKKKDAELSKMRKTFYFECNRATGEVKELVGYQKPHTNPGWASISPDGQTIIFARKNNLYWMDAENFAKAKLDGRDSTIVDHQITDNGVEDFSWGGGKGRISNTSTKHKYYRSGVGIKWSPDSKHFLVQRNDSRKVDKLWVINNTALPRPTLETYNYEMPGEENASENHLYLFNTDTKKYKEVDASAFKFQSMGVYTQKGKLADNMDLVRKPTIWLGDNEKFYMSRTSRDMKRIDICVVDVTAETPTAKALVEERMNTSIESRGIELFNKGKEFVEWSERSGWAHIYLYDAITGEMKRQLTSGEYHSEIVSVDEASRTLYFKAYGFDKSENPYYAHLYKVSLDGGTPIQLTKNGFDNKFTMSDDNSFFVNNFSRVDATPETTLVSNTGREMNHLETADLSQLFASGYKFPEQFKIKAADGVTDLYGIMYKPYDFDSTKLYPIIEYVYPGPQTEVVNTQFSTALTRIDRLAQFGFIVITVGNRGGHPNRSMWYHTYGYGNLRDYGLADKKVAVEQLADRFNFIDRTKVGIHGHSGGGFMSTAAMLVYPDFFKVAVSCAGNHQNNIYNRWWSEKHHGVDEVVSEKGDTTFNYSIGKNADIAKNLKGHLLLIHGDIDNNVHPANTMTVVNALIRNNKRFDMLILPGQRHSFGDMDEYFFWKMGDYFTRYLIGDSETSVDIPQMQGAKTR